MRPTRSVRWLFSLALVSLAGCYHAPPEPGLRIHSVQLPLDAYRLPSGMQVIIEEDHSNPIVGVVAVVSAGSADDPVGKEGLAHLVEHLTYRARPDGKTQRRNLLDYAAAGDVNAMTEPDDTVYWEFGPVRSLEGLIRIEANRLADPIPNIDAPTFQVERNVVLSELTEGDETYLASDIVTWLLKAVFPPGHPYARAPNGTRESLASLQLEDAERFVHDRYVPSRTTWVIAGDVTPAQVKALLMENLPKAAFAPAPTAAAPVSPPVAPVSPLTVAHHVSTAVSKPTLFLVWPLPAADSSSAALDELIAGLVEGGASDWVDPDIQSASASVVPGERASMLECKITLKKGEHPDVTAKKVVDGLSWLQKLDSGGIYDWLFNFNRLQAYEVTSLGTEVEALRARSVRRAVYAQTTHDPAAISKAMVAIQQVTPAEVAGFAKKYLTAERERSVLVLPNPQVKLLRELASDLSRDGKLAKSALGSWSGAGSSTAELRATSASSRVVYPMQALRSLIGKAGFEDKKEFTLASGLKVVAVRRPGWPQITVSLGMPGGIADSEPAGAGYLSQLAVVSRHDNGAPAESGSILARDVGRDMTEIRVTGGNGNLENLLGILDDQVEHSGVSGPSLEWRGKSITEALQKEDTLPAVQAEREVRRVLYGSGVYGRWTDAQVAQQIHGGDVNDWLGRVLRPGNAMLAIVGDFDPQTAQAQVERWLGGWTGPGPSLPEPNVEFPHREAAEVIVKGEKGPSQESVRLACAGPARTYREAVAYEILGEVLSELLDREARQELGATYGFSQSLEWLRGGAWQLDLTAEVNNADLTPVLSQLHHVWATLGRVGIGEETLNRARWKLASKYNLRLQTSRRVAETLVRAYVLGLPSDAPSQYPELLMTVTAAEVKAAAAHCRADSALVLVGDPDLARASLNAIWR